MAEKHLVCLERSSLKKPELYANVRQQILDYQTKDYAHRLTEPESKNSDPRRVWWSARCSAKPQQAWKSTSRVGCCGENWRRISQFHAAERSGSTYVAASRVIPFPSERGCHYRRHKGNVPPDHNLTGRPTCSTVPVARQSWSSCARIHHGRCYLWVDMLTVLCPVRKKTKNAEEWKQRYPEAATAIVENTYVDDYANSSDTVEEAVRVALEVKEIHARRQISFV